MGVHPGGRFLCLRGLREEFLVPLLFVWCATPMVPIGAHMESRMAFIEGGCTLLLLLLIILLVGYVELLLLLLIVPVVVVDGTTVVDVDMCLFR